MSQDKVGGGSGIQPGPPPSGKREMKVLTTEELLDLSEDASIRGYNRQLDTERLYGLLDPDGAHLITPFHVHEHIAGKPAVPHLRCNVLMKLIGEDKPETGWLDVDVSRYRELRDIGGVDEVSESQA